MKPHDVMYNPELADEDEMEQSRYDANSGGVGPLKANVKRPNSTSL